jgi:hypothetical protein
VYFCALMIAEKNEMGLASVWLDPNAFVKLELDLCCTPDISCCGDPKSLRSVGGGLDFVAVGLLRFDFIAIRLDPVTVELNCHCAA